MSGWDQAPLWAVLERLKCPKFQALDCWPYESTRTPCVPEHRAGAPAPLSPRSSYEDPYSEDYLPGCRDYW